MRKNVEKKRAFFRLLAESKSPQELYSGLERLTQAERLESLAPRYDYSQGPMYYIGQRMCFHMAKLGQPSKIFECFRPPARQAKMVESGTSHASPWSSAHQFYEAVDIIHKTRGWPPEDDQYWIDLEAVAKNVEADLGVELIIAKRDWGWDFAHIALKSWPDVKARISAQGNLRPPTSEELYLRFKEVLPRIPHPEDGKSNEEGWERARDILGDMFEAQNLKEMLKDFF